LKDEHKMNLSSAPLTNDDFPPCPCTIFSGFCSRWDLFRGGKEIGTACVADEDAIITMHWMVQCVPKWKKSLTYSCPKHLPLKCDPFRVQDPCDTSMLGTCGKDTCGGGYQLKLKKHQPRFCHLKPCTESECCDACPKAKRKGDQCVDKKSGDTLPDSCCQKHQDLDEFDETEVDCVNSLPKLIGPTTQRLGIYQSVCGFTSADVDTGATSFALSKRGVKKMCSSECQAMKSALGAVPPNILEKAKQLSDQCPDNVALHSQVSPVGVFSAASVLDSTFEACGRGTIDIDAIKENRGSLGKLSER